MTSSNLEVFLDAATPRLPWRSAPMDCFQGPGNVWQLDKKVDKVDYFTLQDLWEHYSESSAYGLSVPVRLHHARTITQHFVPYLSALQIYTAVNTLASALPRSSTGSETDSAWSDDSIIGDKDSRSWDAASDEYNSSHDDVGSVPPRKQGGYLNFQYCEYDPPYERIPLADKVAELALDYPCLTSLNSAELAPSSWLAVAWYPIYHIPYHGNHLTGISACFLTYHSISSVFQDNITVRRGGDRTVALSPFGLAAYRMEEAGKRLWTELPPQNFDAGGGRSSASSSSSLSSLDLYWAASSWLKQVGAQHPDFNFFTLHRSASTRFR